MSMNDTLHEIKKFINSTIADADLEINEFHELFVDVMSSLDDADVVPTMEKIRGFFDKRADSVMKEHKDVQSIFQKKYNDIFHDEISTKDDYVLQKLESLGLSILAATRGIWAYAMRVKQIPPFTFRDERIKNRNGKFPFSKESQQHIAGFMIRLHEDFLIEKGIEPVIYYFGAGESLLEGVFGAPAALASGLDMTQDQVDDAVRVWMDGRNFYSNPIESLNTVLGSERTFSKENLETMFDLEFQCKNGYSIDDAVMETGYALAHMLGTNVDTQTAIDAIDILSKRREADEIFDYVDIGLNGWKKEAERIAEEKTHGMKSSYNAEAVEYFIEKSKLPDRTR